MDIISALQNSFAFPSTIVCFVVAFFLLYIDCKDYKKKGFTKEYKVSKFFGIFYMVFGVVMFTLVRFVLA